MTPVLDQAARLFADMDPSEKASVRQLLDRETNGDFPGVQKTPGVQGGDACIGRTRIPVWVIWGYHTDGMSDRRLLESYPSLTAEDIANAYAYARANLAEMEEALSDNEYGDDEADC